MTPEFRAVVAAIGLVAVICSVLRRLSVVARWQPVRGIRRRISDALYAAEQELIHQQDFGDHDPYERRSRDDDRQRGRPFVASPTLRDAACLDKREAGSEPADALSPAHVLHFENGYTSRRTALDDRWRRLELEGLAMSPFDLDGHRRDVR